MRRLNPLLLLTALLVPLTALQGCNNLPGGKASAGGTSLTADRACAGNLSPADNTRLASIAQLVDDRKPYAALAELDQLGADTPKAKLLRANAWRLIDRKPEAAALYNQLLDTCLAGQAHHGLGLMAAQEGKVVESLQALKQARLLQPTDIRVRNDYGYALLLARQWDDAQFEFLTVLDLQANEPRASRNLVLLAMLQDKPALVQQLTQRLQLDRDALERLQRQANALRPRTPPGAEGPQVDLFVPAMPKASEPPLDTGRPAPMIPPTDVKSNTP